MNQNISHVHVCCKEILTKKLPYQHIRTNIQIVRELIERRKPTDPDDLSKWTKENKALWKIACSCWNFDPFQRPSTEKLLRKLTKLQNGQMMSGDSDSSGDDPPDNKRTRASSIVAKSASTTPSNREQSTKGPPAPYYTTSAAPGKVVPDQGSLISAHRAAPAPPPIAHRRQQSSISQSQGAAETLTRKGSSYPREEGSTTGSNGRLTGRRDDNVETVQSQSRDNGQLAPPLLSLRRSETEGAKQTGRLIGTQDGQNHKGKGETRTKLGDDEPPLKQTSTPVKKVPSRVNDHPHEESQQDTSDSVLTELLKLGALIAEGESRIRRSHIFL